MGLFFLVFFTLDQFLSAIFVSDINCDAIDSIFGSGKSWYSQRVYLLANRRTISL